MFMAVCIEFHAYTIVCVAIFFYHQADFIIITEGKKIMIPLLYSAYFVPGTEFI